MGNVHFLYKLGFFVFKFCCKCFFMTLWFLLRLAGSDQALKLLILWYQWIPIGRIGCFWNHVASPSPPPLPTISPRLTDERRCKKAALDRRRPPGGRPVNPQRRKKKSCIWAEQRCFGGIFPLSASSSGFLLQSHIPWLHVCPKLCVCSFLPV